MLDSHVFLWFTAVASPLSVTAIATIRAADEVFVSAATIWELTIKRSSGKLHVSGALVEKAEEYGFTFLPVTPLHAEAVGDLPFHHRDPFDHLLLAQAKVEGLTLVTHDDILARYGVPVLIV